MKKSVLIFIAVVYVASIVIISFFGMKMSVYNEYIPVSQVLCTNTANSSKNISISASSSGKKVVKILFTTPANIANATGTMLQLETKVLPDNASVKEVKYIYDHTNTNFEFYKDGGIETGLILFYGEAMVSVKIMSTDGRKEFTEIIVWAC